MGKPAIDCPKHGWTERIASGGPCKKCIEESGAVDFTGCDEAIQQLWKYADAILQPGNFGHEFLQGDFVVNDKKKPIYREKDEQYYFFLMKQYGHEDLIRQKNT